MLHPSLSPVSLIFVPRRRNSAPASLECDPIRLARHENGKCRPLCLLTAEPNGILHLRLQAFFNSGNAHTGNANPPRNQVTLRLLQNHRKARNELKASVSNRDNHHLVASLLPIQRRAAAAPRPTATGTLCREPGRLHRALCFYWCSRCSAVFQFDRQTGTPVEIRGAT